jgi:glyoxylase-like metal-dependent hydrolase (beta-lactamase superfamily II)
MDQQPAPIVAPFFDAATSTYSYIVHGMDDPAAIIIDPVLDFDPRSGAITTQSAEQLCEYLTAHALRAEWILETHAHADHLSSAHWLREHLTGPPQVGVCRQITSVQETFKKLLALEAEFCEDGRQFDRLLDDGESFAVGSMRVRVLATPGHTLDSVAFLIGNAAFIGDTMFMPDYGTARCDFPGGDARALYRSIHKILALPDEVRLFVCHDYPPVDRPPRCQTNSADQRRSNIHVGANTSEAEFVQMRNQRDESLAKPMLLWPSVQVNIRAGELPPKDANGRRYLKIPLSGAID